MHERGDTVAKVYAHTFGDRFKLVLIPGDNGWFISVTDERGGVDILGAVTPPFHGMNTRYLEGWHFRNADNTGLNESGPKNVNAPQEERVFYFNPKVGRKPGMPRSELDAPHGEGVLTIFEYKLSNLEPGQHAKFESIKFFVRLSWPRTW